MDLFIMKRYGGDDINNQSKQEDHLSILLAKIENRKRNREKLKSIEGNEILCELIPNESHESPAKKRKFLSEDVNVQPSDVFIPPNNEERTDIIHADSKRKKKLKEEPVNELQSNLINLTDSNGSVLDASKNEATHEILPDTYEDKRGNDISSLSYKNEAGFTIIGTNKFEKRKQVKRILPYWLANPSIMSRNLLQQKVSIHDIPDLDIDIVKKLQKNNIEYFFPVQYEVIPWLLKANRRPIQYRPNDICVSAPTGCGKTLAFVLPIIQALKPRVMQHIRALVVLPVQELAKQIYSVFREYSHGSDLKIMLLKGQHSFAEEQEELVKTSIIIGQYNPVDIVVTTPGRLVDHINHTPGFSLKYVRFLVIDEADRVIENIVDNWLYHVEKNMFGETSGINASLNISSLHSAELPTLQKLLFSATLTQNPEKLEHLKLFQPKLFTTVMKKHGGNDQENEIRGDFIGKYTTPAELIENYCIVDLSFKPLVLYHLIVNENWKNVLCFTNSKESANKLFILLKYLAKGAFQVEALTGSLSQRHRNSILRKFSAAVINVLICSDALARGIDVPNVDCVVLYDAPNYIETYVHRVGRTGRAGKLGTAITLLTSEEFVKFERMLNIAGKQNCLHDISVSESVLENLEEDYQESLRALQSYVKREKRGVPKESNKFKTKGKLKKKLLKT